MKLQEKYNYTTAKIFLLLSISFLWFLLLLVLPGDSLLRTTKIQSIQAKNEAIGAAVNPRSLQKIRGKGYNEIYFFSEIIALFQKN